MSAVGQGALFEREQFRICQLQVYNWGTFSGLHTIPIAESGFLFVGRSGSGKTTLLDAFSALLVEPRSIRFNAAAREDDRRVHDRNWLSYIRGAWAEQKDEGSGEFATQFLRKKATWSAVALTYRNPNGKTVVLVQLFWVKGTSAANGEVHRHYMILERPFALRELEPFGKSFALDLRKLKQHVSDAFYSDRFSVYSERFRRLLGIDNELALKLLHKTQSAKNLGDLNTFLRDFMLDTPATFKAADVLVQEFGELNEAHQAVVVARRQVETLEPARDAWAEREAHLVAITGLESLLEGIDPYRTRLRVGLLEKASRDTVAAIEGAQGVVRQGQVHLDNLKLGLRELESAHREAGGDQIERWEEELQRLLSTRAENLARGERVASACRVLEKPVPDSAETFAELLACARDCVEGWKTNRESLQAAHVALALEREKTQAAFQEVLAEVAVLERQPSNMPGHMLALREHIARALSLGEDALPFVGELVEVRPEASAWQGAIERVLHGFALSMLVPERHYSALAKYVNDHHLNGRLVYYRALRPGRMSKEALPLDALPHKLALKAHDHEDWLRQELEHRFAYRCVESLQQFRQEEGRALTPSGQIRHGKSRHEKDDRHTIDDRRHWVLGFDNREKLALFKDQAGALGDQLAAVEKEIKDLKGQEQHDSARALHSQDLVNMRWQDVDVAPLVERVQVVERKLHDLRESDEDLKSLGEQVSAQRRKLEVAEEQQMAARAEERRLNEVREGLRKDLINYRAQLADQVLTDSQQSGLAERYEEEGEGATLKNLDQLSNRVERKLQNALKERASRQLQCENLIQNHCAAFKRQWPQDASDLDVSLASAPEYIAKLQRLEADRLPAFESRFFALLESQSQQNLASLNMHIQQASREILDRMDLVNLSLRDVSFNVGTYLQIVASNRRTPEVIDFLRDIKEALRHVILENKDDAEERFVRLKALVERLGSQETEHRRWRNAVLDVRLHVEFVGRELNEDHEEVEVYRSGAGKSGGQRQKLATTCLAAALRYQLGGAEDGHPVYAPVVLDEAFDKADNEFTALAMTIFERFGFQMIVATPLKSVMTLEPFIGGACFVDIAERRHSTVILVPYDDVNKRLDLPEQTRGPIATSIP